MDSPRIVDGRVRSGHFVYVRDSGTLSEVEFLGALGLRGYTPDREAHFPWCHYAHIMRASDWSAYADDGFYTAYNFAGISDAVARLGRSYAVLRTAIGDADHSFEFYHFVGGTLRRGFHFDDDHGGRRSIVLDSGSPLRCESAFQLGSNPWPFMCAVADEIGIDSRAMSASVSTYSKPYQKR